MELLFIAIIWAIFGIGWFWLATLWFQINQPWFGVLCLLIGMALFYMAGLFTLSKKK